MPEIPKKWHAIWLGSSLPEAYQANIRTWIAFNPDYEFNLYIDSATLPLSPKENLEFDPDVPCNAIPALQRFCNDNGIKLHDIANIPECAPFLAEPFYNDLVTGEDKVFAFAADVLRLCILYVYGGIYTDVDCICHAPLGQLQNENGFFACGKKYSHGLGICDNWLIATTPKHEFLATCLKTYHKGYSNLIFSGYKKQLGVSPAELCADQELEKSNLMQNPKPHRKLYDDAYRDFRQINSANLSDRCDCFGYMVFLRSVHKFFKEKNLAIAPSVFLFEGIIEHQLANSHGVTNKPAQEITGAKMTRSLFALRSMS